MKNEIYTIPILEAYNENCQCPFCLIKNKLETETVDFVLGSSYMEEMVREQTDKVGFCTHHLRELYLKGNPLGLALITHTHLKYINKVIDKSVYHKNPIFGKKNKDFLSNINNITKSCYICKKIDETFYRYIDTFLFLWKRDEEFRSKVKSSKGFCLEHFEMVSEAALNKFNEKEFEFFYNTIKDITLTNFKKTENDIEYFISKYDYENKDKPWLDKKDALNRGLNLTGSLYYGDNNDK